MIDCHLNQDSAIDFRNVRDIVAKNSRSRNIIKGGWFTHHRSLTFYIKDSRVKSQESRVKSQESRVKSQEYQEDQCGPVFLFDLHNFQCSTGYKITL
ncbi:unnamed protein product [Ambrosiozyma monospora]|uniref:Unnamed protein product n=1 Tax=Ambrosiozyma monospora TaxID=43982 RepID=A0A9W6T2Y3_AMBMO|nr:unnamed protein product [Ambrosiozyma monospora]